MMGTKGEWLCVAITAVWSVRLYLAQREIARLRGRAEMWMERSYHLHDFIKTNFPGAQAQAEKMVADLNAERKN